MWAPTTTLAAGIVTQPATQSSRLALVIASFATMIASGAAQPGRAAGSAVAAFSEQKLLRRCYVCPRAGGSNFVEAVAEAPAYADRCAMVIVEVPTVCQDLLNEDRLRALKDEGIQEASRLEKGGDQVAAWKKKGEVAILWSALRKVSEQNTEKLWGQLFSEMENQAQELVGHGLTQEAGQILAAKEVVKAGRSSSRLRGFQQTEKKAQEAAVAAADEEGKEKDPFVTGGKVTVAGLSSSFVRSSVAAAPFGNQVHTVEEHSRERPDKETDQIRTDSFVIHSSTLEEATPGSGLLVDVPKLSLPEDPLYVV